MNKKKAVLFGLSGFSEVVDFYLTHDSEYEVVAFTASDEAIDAPLFLGRPVIPWSKIESSYSPEDTELFISVGYVKLNEIRQKFVAEAKEKGYRLLSYVCSKATTWPNLNIGENVFIFEDNTIQPFVKIGDNNIFWSGNHIGHHTEIGCNNFFSSHVVVSGYCKIGNNSFFGVNSTLADSLTIGDRNLIGPGAMLQKSTADDEVYFGARADMYDGKSSRFFK